MGRKERAKESVGERMEKDGRETLARERAGVRESRCFIGKMNYCPLVGGHCSLPASRVCWGSCGEWPGETSGEAVLPGDAAVIAEQDLALSSGCSNKPTSHKRRKKWNGN